MTVITVKGVRYQARFPLDQIAAALRQHLEGADVRVHVHPDDDVVIRVAAPHGAVLTAAHMYLDPLAVEWSHDGGENHG